MSTSVKLVVLSLLIHFSCLGQKKEKWIDTPKADWPQIALINKVQYKNGNQYIAPSFTYAGTGFLIDNGADTLAATAKHVLWIARNRKSGYVQINDDLDSWTMTVKGNKRDSAIIGRLLNEDSMEVLEGPASTILERDAIFFTVQHASPNIYPLKPRYTPVQPGEKVYFISSDYTDSAATAYEGTVLRKLGMDILVERNMNEFHGGASGSPVIDANGYLVGITSTATTDGKTGKGVVVAISMEYLQDVLNARPGLNISKQDYGQLVYETVLNKGVKKAIWQYKKLANNPRSYYSYNLRSANRNGLRETGEKLMETKRYKDAIAILTLNIKENSSFYLNYNILARAHLLAGDTGKAIANYQLSITKFDDKTENEAFKELEKLKFLPQRHK